MRELAKTPLRGPMLAQSSSNIATESPARFSVPTVDIEVSSMPNSKGNPGQRGKQPRREASEGAALAEFHGHGADAANFLL
jgi:hypothetical protein